MKQKTMMCAGCQREMEVEEITPEGEAVIAYCSSKCRDKVWFGVQDRIDTVRLFVGAPSC